jgi:uncharacterized membrane protein HdeD (DUF308 family)
VNVAALVHNWWMMAGRGGLAIVFGFVLLLWPNVTLPIVVLLFGAYALLDGVWTIAAGWRASAKLFDAWPVTLEGMVSVALGALSLLWPFVPRQFIYVLAGWGIVTGALEILAAIHLPPARAGHWLLATGGFSSLFLAFLILLLPYAAVDRVVHLIAAYALVFGLALLLAAIRFSRLGAGSTYYAETHG